METRGFYCTSCDEQFAISSERLAIYCPACGFPSLKVEVGGSAGSVPEVKQPPKPEAHCR